MAAKVAVLCFMISSLLLAPVSADGPVDVDALKSKIRVLESSVEEKSKELKSKEEALALKDRAIKEKADRVESLLSELSSLQKKEKHDAAVEKGKARALTEELEIQVKPNQEVEAKIKQKEALENRLSKSETKTMKHDKEELVKAKQEESTKIKELTEVHAAWLPPWLASDWSQYQSFIEMHWNIHGKPAMDIIIQKATEKKAQTEEWAKPHVEKMKKEYLPAVQQQSFSVKASVVPHIQSLTTKVVEIYDTSKKAVTPHVAKVQEVADPYYQEARKFGKPYIEQVVTLSKPHINRLRLAMMPYTKKAVPTYEKFLKSASSCDNQKELVKAKQEASTKIKESTEVHASWLPPWRASHWSQYQSFIEMHWNIHGKPAMDIIIQKAMEKKAQAEEWAKPHVEKMKNEYLPAVRQQSFAVKAYVVPHIESLTAKVVEIYDTSKKAVAPHVAKVQEVVDPIYQEIRKFGKPYLEQVATLSKPHFDKLRLAMMPHSKKAVPTYGKFLKSASSCDNHVSVSSCIVITAVLSGSCYCLTLLMMIFNLMPSVAVFYFLNCYRNVDGDSDAVAKNCFFMYACVAFYKVFDFFFLDGNPSFCCSFFFSDKNNISVCLESYGRDCGKDFPLLQ